MTYDQYVEQIKSFLLKQLVDKVYDIIITKITFLSWGPLGPLLKIILEKIIEIILYETEMAIFFLYTDLRVNAQGRKFYDAIEANMEAQEGGNEEDKQRTEKELIDSFRELVKLTN